MSDNVDALLAEMEEARLPGRDADWSREGQEARRQKLARLVEQAQTLGIYPAETVEGNPNTVLQMVCGHGVRWNEWRGPLACRHCGADLRAKEGPPFKREIGVYDGRRDRTVAFVCPDCRGTL